MKYIILNRPDMGQFATMREARYWAAWIGKASGTTPKVVTL